jgi:hypothetical protein
MNIIVAGAGATLVLAAGATASAIAGTAGQNGTNGAPDVSPLTVGGTTLIGGGGPTLIQNSSNVNANEQQVGDTETDTLTVPTTTLTVTGSSTTPPPPPQPPAAPNVPQLDLPQLSSGGLVVPQGGGGLLGGSGPLTGGGLDVFVI